MARSGHSLGRAGRLRWIDMESERALRQGYATRGSRLAALRVARVAPLPSGWLMAVAAFTLALLPYAVGFLCAPRGQSFLGVFQNELDVSQYLAALRQGAHGQLLFTNQYTDAPIHPVLMYTLYTLAGFVARPLHVPAIALYGLLLATGVLTMLYSGWRLCGVFHPGRQRLAYALLLCAGGLYVPWSYQIGGGHALFGLRLLLDSNDSTLLAALQLPHIAGALAVEMAIMLAYLSWRRTGRARTLVLLALLAICLGLLAPFLLLTVYGACALHMVGGMAHGRLTAMRTRWTGVRSAAALALALAPSLALALYYDIVFGRDPLWSHTLMRDPEPPHLATVGVCYGMLLLALALAWRHARRLLWQPGVPLLLSWILVTGLLVVLPLPQPRRYLLGLPIPLALLSVYLAAAMPRAARAMALLTLCYSSVATILTLSWTVGTDRYPGYYLDAGTRGVIAYLARHTSARDVVLGPERLCDLAVGFMPARVVLGHYYETPDVLALRRAVTLYNAPSTSAAARARFEASHQVTLLVVAPEQERLLDGIRHAARYRTVYAAWGYTVLKIAI